jgi:hypothetical protein
MKRFSLLLTGYFSLCRLLSQRNVWSKGKEYDIWATTNSATYEVSSEPIRHSDAHRNKHMQTEQDTIIYFPFSVKA